ncbi:glycine rich domain-containing protein [Prevotella sp.]|uniref:glycine rich domain-containing protein n=1 Tax=Prevotella sp. TaxID=59823 RepID=UPI003DA49DAE
MKYYIPPNTGSMQQFMATNAGTYKLEVWGAQGGTDSSDEITAGKGGYARGQINLTNMQIIYVCIGGQGGSTASTGSGGYITVVVQEDCMQVVLLYVLVVVVAQHI